MDEQAARDPLAAWALGTFHATLFLVTLVLLAHRAGAVGGIVGSLDTLRGLLLFVALWAASWWSARGALQDAAKKGARLSHTFFWGGVTGVLFLWALLLVVVLPLAAPDRSPSVLVGVALFVVIASAVAFLVGGVVGLAFQGLDLLVLKAAATRRGA